MRYLTYSADNGQTVTLCDTPPYFMEAPPKYAAGSSAQVIKPPGLDGQDTCNVSLDAGNIYVEGRIVSYGDGAHSAQRQLDALRSRLCYAFDPRSWGELTLHTEAGDRRIRCRPPALPTFGGNFNNSCPFAVELVADNPFWRGPENTGMAGNNYFNHRFPAFLPESGMPFAVNFSELIVYNAAPLDIQPVIEVYETFGQLVSIQNETTGAAIAVNRAVPSGKKMVIDTERATVWLWRQEEPDKWSKDENALNWLSVDSDTSGFRIVPGVNTLSVNRAMSGQKPVMKIIWSELFLGV